MQIEQTVDERIAKQVREWRAEVAALQANIAAATGESSVRAVVGQAPVTADELLRAMDAWGACGFVVDERAVNFLNYFLGSRCAAAGQPGR